MTNQTIPPALTAEEWEQGFADWGVMYDHSGVSLGSPSRKGISVYTDGDDVDVAADQLPSLIALANHALPDGHPLKITRADVVAARRISHDSGGWTDENRDIVERLAAKLAALLPPEDA